LVLKRFGDASLDVRLRWLRLVVPIAFICGVLLSPSLWFDFGRSFPRAPLLGFSFHYDFVIAIVLVGTLLLSAIATHPRRYLIASVILTIALVFLDQTRLQPWVYQYAIMLALLVFMQRDNVKPIFAASQLVIATLYFWSGLQKLSWTFIHDTGPTLLESSGIHLAPRYLTIVAIIIAVGETLIGVGLLLRRTRRVAVVIACLMHAVILFTFILTQRNSVIWPWNVAMMLFTVILFQGNDESPFSGSRAPVKVTIVICGLLPALSFFGWWDLNLSGALYSGNTPIAVMRMSEGLRERLPEATQKHVFTSRGELMIPFFEWSSADLNVPPYPEVRVYRQLARQLCTLDSDPTNALIIRERPALRDGSYNVTTTTCATLLAR
jgi:hypothetical protein